ncbi:hypothetical protein T492DRAFT_1030903, partial [Pavlovales sp. CCMP2436]
LVEVVDDEEAENKALESLRNAGPPDSVRASESIGDPSGDVSLGSDVVLNVGNSCARAGLGPQRRGAVEGLVGRTVYIYIAAQHGSTGVVQSLAWSTS